MDHSIEKVDTKDFPLISYAAKHWMVHARFPDVSSHIWDGIDLLFDKEKPHFATWVGIHNIDHRYLSRSDTPEECQPFPLYYAALCGIGGLVERLFTAHPQDPDAADGYYGAPLNAALVQGYLDIAQLLLDHGAVGKNMGGHDQTGLYIASSRGYANVVRSLIDRGANLNARCTDCDTDCGDQVWTPLHAAIYNDHPDIVVLLLEGGADPETRSSEDQTALSMASSRGRANIVRSLIDRGADLNAKSKDKHQKSYYVQGAPLFMAIEEEYRDIVLLLLEGGADTEVWNSYQKTPLYMASCFGPADIVRQLISHGADLNAESEFGYTALHGASSDGRPEILRILLEHGANPNALTHSGRTALHLAEEATVVELLLEYGANVDVRDNERWTPLHHAADMLNLQVLVALLGRGADPHAETNMGETPFQLANAPYEWASKKDQAQVIQLLSERTGECV